jgi:hypothetical protein
MSVRDTVLGAIAAFAISAAAFAYIGIREALSLTPPDGDLQLAPVLAGGYAAVVGVGLLIGSRLLRDPRPEG